MLCEGQNVFLQLPTGYGQSLMIILQCLRIAADALPIIQTVVAKT